MSNSSAPVIVWFTNDLRIHDHAALFEATKLNLPIIGVYCFDERHYRPTHLGFCKTGGFRTQFLIESVTVLRQQLASLNIPLVVCVGKPENEIFQLAQLVKARYIFGSQEVGTEEATVQAALERQLVRASCQLKLFWQASLLHIEDLPYSLQSLPDVFTEFRKSVERRTRIRSILATPTPIKAFDVPVGVVLGTMPTVAMLGVPPATIDPRSVLPFRGGEVAALERLQTYIWDKDLLKVYKDTRNGLIGADYSSKFSAWLAVGAVSPRKIYEEILRYEAQRVQNESTYWLFFELLWRDYFRFVAQKYQRRLFLPDGLKGNYMQLQLKDNKAKFQRWVQGQTGQPFVDANMRELQQTGFMSNRGRQNVASYLVKDMKVNWRWGAMYFESQLVDYDVCSNWGNWNYVAGVGNDPRENRYFNVASQAQRYDPEGHYIKLWS